MYLWDTFKLVMRENFLSLNTCISKNERIKMYDFSF